VLRSSIFSFNTLQYRGWGIPAWLWAGIVLLIGAEACLRIPYVTQHLPPYEPTLWHMPIIQTKMEYLQEYEAQNDIDVLFIGNSTMQAGVSPIVFDHLRRQEGSFNAAIEGLPPYGIKIFLHIYEQYSQPKTIIYGLTPQDLNSNSPWAKDVTNRVKESPLALAEARYGWKGHFYAWLLKHSALFRYRGVLHQLLLRGGSYVPAAEPYFDTRGYDALENQLSDVPRGERGQYINRAGVLNYAVQGEQLNALSEIIEYCQTHDIRLIFVNMPLADDYFQNFDTLEDYKTYLTTMQGIASEYGVPLWDMEDDIQMTAFGDDAFADFNHLNQNGAEQLSQLLAEQYQQWVLHAATPKVIER
jgi:hypothetical protein